jgi:hypothetical protein
MAKKSRLVRGETGAVFEVDAAMVDDPRVVEGPFRAADGPVSTDAIKPAAPRRRWPLMVGIALVLVLASACLLGLGASSTPVMRSESVDVRTGEIIRD